MSATKKSIDKKIIDLGLEVQGRAGDGCYYFTATATDAALDAESVYIGSMRHLTLARWREEALEALESDAGAAFVPTAEREADSPVIVLRGIE